MQISEASSVDEALELIMQDNYNLIFTDISMPGRSGFDLLLQVKKEYPATPVLMFSMHGEDQFAVRALQLGASGYITKSCNSVELLLAVKKILAGKKYISASVSELLVESISVDRPQPIEILLSKRELEVFKLIASGRSITEISKILVLGINTISTYRLRILGKMKLQTNAELMRYAFEQNIDL